MNYPAILYVEDDPRSRKVMNLLLGRQMGLSHFTILEDSTDFLVRAEALQPKPDVVLLDIHMHPYNGFQMLTMLRESNKFKDTPVVALTASVMNEEVQSLKDAGFHGIIAKPIDTATFPGILNRVLSGELIWRVID
jgi:CheY-like chemotaxis protein